MSRSSNTTKKQPLAIFDIDGTLFRWQLYHELVFSLKEDSIFDEETTENLDLALFEWQAKRRSWHDYEMEIVKAFEPVIANLSPESYAGAVERVVKRSGHKTYAYTTKLLKELQDSGYYTLAISGSQQEIAELFTKSYGFDDCIGALYERSDDKNFTGHISRRVPGRKHEIIEEYLDQHPNLTIEGSVAVGDSDGDISMLELVDNPIAFNPSHDLLAEAQKNNWKVVIERKDVIYHLEKGSDGLLVLAKTE